MFWHTKYKVWHDDTMTSKKARKIRELHLSLQRQRAIFSAVFALPCVAARAKLQGLHDTSHTETEGLQLQSKLTCTLQI